MCGSARRSSGLLSNSAMSCFRYSVKVNGPPQHERLPPVGSFGNVLRALPSPVAYCCQTCGGRIDVNPTPNSAMAEGLVNVATSVFGSGAG